jgi:microsomal dipeptidase-like Zn-dependent dipeptidase
VTTPRPHPLSIAAAFVALAAGALVWLSANVERFANRIESGPLPVVSEAARALHRESRIVDLHSDTLLWDRDLLANGSVGHVDLPRLERGGVALQVFTVVTRFPVTANLEHTDGDGLDAITLLGWAQGGPRAAPASLVARARLQARRLDEAVQRSDGRLQAIRTKRDLERLLAHRTHAPDVVGALLGIEGAHALDDDLANLPVLVDAGVRMVGLVHFFDNAFAGSAHGSAKGGLTPLGRELVRELERRGVLVDLAHASEKTIEDVLALATHPVVVSHTGVRATCDNARNLSDDQIRAIAAKGGVIGIGYWATAVCGTRPADVARAIRHVADLVGDSHVALGSDWDGARTVGFDAAHLPVLTQALLDAGLSDASIHRVLGENALRVLAATLPER